jgi:hypothetical protein
MNDTGLNNAASALACAISPLLLSEDGYRTEGGFAPAPAPYPALSLQLTDANGDIFTVEIRRGDH